MIAWTKPAGYRFACLDLFSFSPIPRPSIGSCSWLLLHFPSNCSATAVELVHHLVLFPCGLPVAEHKPYMHWSQYTIVTAGLLSNRCVTGSCHALDVYGCSNVNTPPYLSTCSHISIPNLSNSLALQSCFRYSFMSCGLSCRFFMLKFCNNVNKTQGGKRQLSRV